eukprot:3906728-Rhodomonas_salina.3
MHNLIIDRQSTARNGSMPVCPDLPLGFRHHWPDHTESQHRALQPRVEASGWTSPALPPNPSTCSLIRTSSVATTSFEQDLAWIARLYVRCSTVWPFNKRNSLPPSRCDPCRAGITCDRQSTKGGGGYT